jgi:hypothetical protein
LAVKVVDLGSIGMDTGCSAAVAVSGRELTVSDKLRSFQRMAVAITTDRYLGYR